MARRRRTLSEEEKALWSKVAESAVPLHEQSAAPEPDHEQRPVELAPTSPASRGMILRPQGRPAPPTRFDPAPAPGAEPVNMDRRAFERMTRGRLTPQARLDLHGMTTADAHLRLRGFILRAHSEGLRLVLVITGKGRRGAEDAIIPERHGVLRHQVPHWLRLPPLGPLVLQIAPAHRRHGGEGAYYVYLRRSR
ncbi:Smr/MutS family protein [Pontivivens ytuae]|uniref:Smr/MutS family protein n=1 Tax=Pontivivens ytuae TaxID=2789856 RepID=A0A7S9LV95_9RHOB|nr:Smr/MutS family protein [Pontivivens ytuae]QPH55899.1 Smr/MutS family protein [Pontivivens ytuae]